jgi:undecaprenyl phosphate-alpha-L-ara4N flippase subunit ArnF
MMRGEKHGGAMLFVGGSVILSACAQLLMKISMNELHGVGVAEVLQNLPATIGILVPAGAWGLAGLGCYAVSMMLWLVALSRCDLSLAYPMLSLSYVLVYIAAVYWPRLGESATTLKTAGIMLIVAGVMLVARVPRREEANVNRPGNASG